MMRWSFSVVILKWWCPMDQKASWSCVRKYCSLVTEEYMETYSGTFLCLKVLRVDWDILLHFQGKQWFWRSESNKIHEVTCKYKGLICLDILRSDVLLGKEFLGRGNNVKFLNWEATRYFGSQYGWCTVNWCRSHGVIGGFSWKNDNWLQYFSY